MAGEPSTDTRQALITITTDGRHTPAIPLVRDIMATGVRPAQAGWLPPRQDLERARRGMAIADEQQCSEADAARWAGLLVMAFPQASAFKGEGAEQQAKVFMRSMALDMRQYPLDVVEAAVHLVRRNVKFMPTCAEFCAAADRIMRPRRELAACIAAQLREHDRRQAEEDRLAGIETYSSLSEDDRAEFCRLADAAKRAALGDDYDAEPTPPPPDAQPVSQDHPDGAGGASRGDAAE